MKFKILICILFASVGIAAAQSGKDTTVMETSKSCGIDVTSVAIPALFEFESNAEANAVMSDIMKVVGLPANFRIQAADVPNAAAVVLGTTRYILYNPGFIKKVNKSTDTDWSSISILAHELGHHLGGHTLESQGSRPKMELEADEFSGFVLRKMGASLEESQAAMNLLASPFGSISHPPKAQRLKSIEKGWIEADEQIKSYGGQPVLSETNKKKDDHVGDLAQNEISTEGSEVDDSPVSAAPPIPDTKKHPVFAIYKVELYANKKSDYYITKGNEFVLYRDGAVRSLGQLVKIKDSNYTSTIKMSTNSPDLFIAKGGFLYTENGNKVGEVKRVN